MNTCTRLQLNITTLPAKVQKKVIELYMHINFIRNLFWKKTFHCKIQDNKTRQGKRPCTPRRKTYSFI